MAGLRDNCFQEKVSPFLANKMREVDEKYGPNSREARALSLQYRKDPREDYQTTEVNRRHYEAEIVAEIEGEELVGLERLYRRVLVIEPTMICAAHCRYCLRANYDQYTLTDHQLLEIAKYCGHDENRRDLREVLITGGDPLIVPHKLNFLIEALEEHAPNIQIIRIGSRLMAQQPNRIGNSVFNTFETHSRFRFEIGTQLTHSIELFPEVCETIAKIQDRGVRFYSQNVLLKGINDDIGTLIDLYDTMRELDIEAHYLFHCVPMKGIHHFRTSIERGIDLINQLTSCGGISGRAKPMFAAMTDIGKITFYEGVIKEANDQKLLLQSSYSIEERKRWAPGYKLPETAEVDKNGFLRVWYQDGED